MNNYLEDFSLIEHFKKPERRNGLLKAEQCAHDFLNKYSLRTMDDLYKKLPKLRLEIEGTNQYPMCLSGNSFVYENKKFIVLNSNHPNLKRWGTFLHELGHHLLHHPKGLKTSRRRTEKQADIFAATVLNHLTDSMKDRPEWIKNNTDIVVTRNSAVRDLTFNVYLGLLTKGCQLLLKNKKVNNFLDRLIYDL